MITLTRLIAVKEEPVVPVAARMEILDPCDQSEARRHEQRVFRVEREVSGFVGHRGGQRALHGARKIYELFGVDRAVLNIRTDVIGRATCRDRVCQYGKISVVAVNLKKKEKKE